LRKILAEFYQKSKLMLSPERKQPAIGLPSHQLGLGTCILSRSGAVCQILAFYPLNFFLDLFDH
jgi:hypothetical protein